MAYLPSNNWWLNGPKNPQGGGCGGACGETGFAGLGQTQTTPMCNDPNATFSPLSGCSDGSTPTCPSGTNFNGIGCSTENLLIGNPLLPVGATSSIIPGVSNTYVYIGGAILFGILLLGVMKK
jgi:hypothetical protein